MILVTGGSGFVGRALVRRLHRSGETVRVLSRNVDHLRGSFPDGVDLQAGDLGYPASLQSPLSGIQVVVHLAAAVGKRSATELNDINVRGAAALARAAIAARVSRFIHVSSAGVYGDHPHARPLPEEAPLLAAAPYELSKLRGEQAVLDTLRGSGTGWVVLRPGGVYGGKRALTRQFLAQVSRQRWWLHAPPRLLLHPTYVDDVVQAIELALQRPHALDQVFNIGGDRIVAFDEWVREVAAALDVRVHQLVLPGAVAVPAARAASAVLRFGRVHVPERLMQARSAILSRTLDLSKARRQLGFVPKPLQEALTETVGDYRAEQEIRGARAS